MQFLSLFAAHANHVFCRSQDCVIWRKFLHVINLENSEYLKMVSLEFALRKPNGKAAGLWWLVRTSWFWLSQGPCRPSHSKGKCCKFNHVWAVWHHDNKFPHNSQLLFSPMTTSFRAVWNAHLFFSGFKTARNFCFHCQASQLQKTHPGATSLLFG